MQKFIGTGVALITPFKNDLSIDYDALEKLVEYNITNGINYLVINGTTGESGVCTTEPLNELQKQWETPKSQEQVEDAKNG